MDTVHRILKNYQLQDLITVIEAYVYREERQLQRIKDKYRSHIESLLGERCRYFNMDVILDVILDHHIETNGLFFTDFTRGHHRYNYNSMGDFFVRYNSTRDEIDEKYHFNGQVSDIYFEKWSDGFNLDDFNIVHVPGFNSNLILEELFMEEVSISSKNDFYLYLFDRLVNDEARYPRTFNI
jgi:hypothetical protein